MLVVGKNGAVDLVQATADEAFETLFGTMVTIGAKMVIVMSDLHANLVWYT